MGQQYPFKSEITCLRTLKVPLSSWIFLRCHGRDQGNRFLMTGYLKAAKLQEEKQTQEQVIAEQKAKIQMQDEDIAKQMQMLEELKLQHDALMSRITNCKMEELEALVESSFS